MWNYHCFDVYPYTQIKRAASVLGVPTDMCDNLDGEMSVYDVFQTSINSCLRHLLEQEPILRPSAYNATLIFSFLATVNTGTGSGLQA